VRIELFVGDLLKAPADAICTSTNPWLSLQAGTGGAVRLFGGHTIQEACDGLLKAAGRRHFPTGTAHLTHAGGLGFRGVVHCVAIDAFHGSSEAVIESCVREALAVAEREGFAHLAMPVFATGNGRFPLGRAVRAMQAALHAHQGTAVEQVSIAVPDGPRADKVGWLLSRPHPVAVASERDAQLTAWVAPIYLQVLHGNHLSLHSADRDEFLADAGRAVAEADEAGLRQLLRETNWRPRLAAAWLAGILRSRRLEARIGGLLLESEVCYAGQGYCFALARFGTPTAARALERYLTRWLPRTDCDYDQEWAMAALATIDETRAESHLGPWTDFALATCRYNPAGALATARARLAAMGKVADQLTQLPG
jgi:O-acetyl-ADP-ribose deacetylase (regulator of RNase III)